MYGSVGIRRRNAGRRRCRRRGNPRVARPARGSGRQSPAASCAVRSPTPRGRRSAASPGGAFKRLMGTDVALEFPAAGLKKRPEELAALVLEALRHDVEAQTGVLPEQAVIAVPAMFELPQIAATAEAARLAGFARVETL